MKYILLLLTLMYLVSSCNGNHQQRDILSRAERLMNDNPDSALTILVKDSSQVANFPRSLKMKYELLVTSAQNKTFVSFKSDSIMKEVVDYYDSHGTPNDQIQAHYLLGCVYFKLNDAPKAMRCLHEAIEKVDTTGVDCDYNLLSRVYNVMGYIYGRQLDYDNSLRQLHSAYKYAMLSKDTLLAINCYEQRIDAYSILKKTDSVISISERVSAMYRKMNMNREAAVALSPSLFEHLEQGDVMKAKSELDYIESQPDLFDKYGHITENLNLYYFKGAYYMNIGRMDSAEYYYRLGLKTEKNMTNKVELCKGMYQLHKKLGQKDSTVKYVELWNSFSDSLYATLTTSTLQQMQSFYDYSRNQEIAETKSEEARVANNKFYLILFICVILLFISYEFFIYYKRKKNIEIQHLSESLLEKLRELDFLKDENLRNIELLDAKQSEYNLLREESASDKELLFLKKSSIQ
jgi:tetratricopeptide (TPR) repeat protein